MLRWVLARMFPSCCSDLSLVWKFTASIASTTEQNSEHTTNNLNLNTIFANASRVIKLHWRGGQVYLTWLSTSTTTTRLCVHVVFGASGMLICRRVNRKGLNDAWRRGEIRRREVNLSGDDVDRLSFTHLDDLDKCPASLLCVSICKWICAAACFAPVRCHSMSPLFPPSKMFVIAINMSSNYGSLLHHTY